MSMNPFCEIAVEVTLPPHLFRCHLKERQNHLKGLKRLERAYCIRQEALRLKGKKLAEEVVAVSLGPKACQVRRQASTVPKNLLKSL